MKVFQNLFAVAAGLILAACQSASPNTSSPSPAPAHEAQVIVGRLKAEAGALRKLDVLELEGTAGFPAGKRTAYQQRTRELASSYAEQYRQDLGKLLDLPRGAVEEVFEPLVKAESSASPRGGIYQTMSLHQRMARLSSEPSWWEFTLFWRSRPPSSAFMADPTTQQIIQDYQALRYLAPPDKHRQ